MTETDLIESLKADRLMVVRGREQALREVTNRIKAVVEEWHRALDQIFLKNPLP